ncbi:hypothetical protein FBU31_001295 [Coemansia sp. 'formosensis']|nr:hypothetical protein FBU31_001295 [Coemansia sp. 'formosensis']
MKLFSATAAIALLLAATAAAAPSSISFDANPLSQLISFEQGLLNEGRNIANQLQSALSVIKAAFEGDVANAILNEQQAVINSLQQANQSLEKVIDTLNSATI